MPPPRQGLGESELQRPRLLETRIHPPHDTITDLGWTRAQAATTLAMSERQVYYWISGETPVPTMIAAVLKLLREGRIAVEDLT
jgi:hypothetical protein